MGLTHIAAPSQVIVKEVLLIVKTSILFFADFQVMVILFVVGYGWFISMSAISGSFGL